MCASVESRTSVKILYIEVGPEILIKIDDWRVDAIDD